MNSKKIIKYFSLLVLIISLFASGLSFFYSTAFGPSAIFMFALFMFSVCYCIKDSNKKLLYILFVFGVLLIGAALIYTYLRLS